MKIIELLKKRNLGALLIIGWVDVVTGLICATTLAMHGNWVFATLFYLASFGFGFSLQINHKE